MATQGGAAASEALTRLGALNRRQFIASSAGLLAGAYLLGPTAARDHEEGPLGALLHNSTRALSIGFIAAVHGSEALVKGARVVPAVALRNGSRALHGMTEFSLHGLSAGLIDPVAAGINALHLDALVPAPREMADKTPLPFHAYTLRPGSHSVPSSFALDLDSKPRLGLALDVQPSSTEPAKAVFTTGRQSGMAKLRSGTYLLGLSPGVWDRVRTLPDPADEAAWASARLASLVISVKPAA